MANAGLISTIFSKIDNDNSGSISQSEMDDVFKVFDKDGNGSVSKEEFQQTFVSVFSGTADQANRVFCKLDKDNSGDISLSEISALFKDMDSNGDGSVCKDEFSAKWTQLLS